LGPISDVEKQKTMKTSKYTKIKQQQEPKLWVWSLLLCLPTPDFEMQSFPSSCKGSIISICQDIVTRRKLIEALCPWTK
jgi:hypothetical protein